MSIFETEDIDEALRLTFGLPGEKMEKEIGVVTMKLRLTPGIGKVSFVSVSFERVCQD